MSVAKTWMDAAVCRSSLLWAGPSAPTPKGFKGPRTTPAALPCGVPQRSREGSREKNGKTGGRCQLVGPVSLEEEKFRENQGKSGCKESSAL